MPSARAVHAHWLGRVPARLRRGGGPRERAAWIGGGGARCPPPSLPPANLLRSKPPCMQWDLLTSEGSLALQACGPIRRLGLPLESVPRDPRPASAFASSALRESASDPRRDCGFCGPPPRAVTSRGLAKANKTFFPVNLTIKNIYRPQIYVCCVSSLGAYW